MATKQTRPDVTAAMRTAAMRNPNSWLYVIDPALDPAADVPPWGVIGAYPVNALGQIEEIFHHNAGYRPAEPAPVLDRLLELVRDGEREETELLAAVLTARLLVYAAGPDDGSVTAFPDRGSGSVAVPACTSAGQVPPAWPGWREISGRDLVARLHGHPLVINPDGPVTALIPAADLAGALGATVPTPG